MLTVDWPNKVIFIPKSYLSPGANPSAFLLDINNLHLDLRHLEETQGMAYPQTHEHNTAVEISGVNIARVVRIINGYSVTFEEGAYSVNLSGGNSNISDVANFNTVRVNSNNTAGLQVVETRAPLSDVQNDALIGAFTLVQLLRKYESNKTKINEADNTLTVFDDDGATVIQEFDLRDRNGNGSIEEIFERIPRALPQ